MDVNPLSEAIMPRWWTRFLLCCFVLVSLPVGVQAAPPDPLRLIPQEAGIALVVENPRKIAEALRDLDAYRSFQAFPEVREVLDSTAVRRFWQLVDYYERELGAKWPELLDKLAGGGLVIGIAIADDPAPALLAIQGTEEATVAEFFQLATRLLEQEVARQTVDSGEAPKIRKSTHAGFETIHLGDDFHTARSGSIIYVSNKEASLRAGLDLVGTRKKGKSLADRAEPKAARKLLGGDPLAWLWFDFAKVKQGQGAKDFFAATRKDFLQTMVLGSSIDAFRRSDFISAGLYQTDDGLKATLRLPAKRADLPPEYTLHVPSVDKPGSLPLLEPKGVIYSQSFYLDIGTLWTERKKLLNEQVLKDLEKAENDISKILPGTTLGKVLEASGPYHRIVAVHRDEKPYGVLPDQHIPPLALVSSMRDPQFGKTASSALRSAAFVASINTGLKMTEEKHDGITIVSYRFPENRKMQDDNTNIRFNFVPSFAVVGDFLVTASSPGLIKDLIPELRKTPDPTKNSTAVWRAKAFGTGVANLLRANPDPLVTNAILRDGIGLEDAKKQIAILSDWVATQGNVALEISHEKNMYQLQFEWKRKP